MSRTMKLLYLIVIVILLAVVVIRYLPQWYPERSTPIRVKLVAMEWDDTINDTI